MGWIQFKAVNTVYSAVTAVRTYEKTTPLIQQSIAHQRRSFTSGYETVHLWCKVGNCYHCEGCKSCCQCSDASITRELLKSYMHLICQDKELF